MVVVPSERSLRLRQVYVHSTLKTFEPMSSTNSISHAPSLVLHCTSIRKQVMDNMSLCECSLTYWSGLITRRDVCLINFFPDCSTVALYCGSGEIGIVACAILWMSAMPRASYVTILQSRIAQSSATKTHTRKRICNGISSPKNHKRGKTKAWETHLCNR
jgi:hypothetical protein